MLKLLLVGYNSAKILRVVCCSLPGKYLPLKPPPPPKKNQCNSQTLQKYRLSSGPAYTVSERSTRPWGKVATERVGPEVDPGTVAPSGKMATTTMDGGRKPAWQPESQHHDSSLSRLAGGMLTSAWDGVCSGVTAAALKAVEHTAGAFFNKDGKQTVDQGAQSIMACLAGSAADPPPAQMSAPAPKPAVPSDNLGPDQLMLSVLEMQKQQMQQQTILQQQLLRLQEAQSSPPSSLVQNFRAPVPARSKSRQKASTPASAPSTPASAAAPKQKAKRPAAGKAKVSKTGRRVRAGSLAKPGPKTKPGRSE